MKKWYLILTAVLLAAGILCQRRISQTAADMKVADMKAADAAAAEEAETADPADAVKQVAITFDDGPNPDYTLKLLEGLKKRGVKATFFVLGEEVELYPDILREIYEEGHLIGVHSYQHVNFTEIGDTATIEQIERTQEAIYEVTGEYAGYIRPPYGSWRKELDEKVPLIEVLWNVDPMDWAVNDADTVVQRIETHVEEGSIILLHDASESTVQAALRTIDLLEEQGYTFVTVETLLIE
jgi:peptidoglycan/xylan/chitin deacetylase (PgdA/CDA1 family)